MAIVTVYNDVLGEPTTTKIKDLFLVDYLKREFKDGFNQPVDVFVNDSLLSVEAFDIALCDKDVIKIIFKPAEMVTGILISMAVSYLINALFAEDEEISMPTSSTSARGLSNPQSVYSLTNNNNKFASGQAIPVIYGNIKTTPSLVTPPRRFYHQVENEEYLYQLFCLGVGDVDVNKVLVGELDSVDIKSDVFSYNKITQADLNGVTIGEYISSLYPSDYGYYENTKVLASIGDLEVRGRPVTDVFRMSFTASTKTIIFKDSQGIEPDLTALQSGSTITVTNSISNNNAFTVNTVDVNTLTVTVDEIVVDESNNTTSTSSSYTDWLNGGFNIRHSETPGYGIGFNDALLDEIAGESMFLATDNTFKVVDVDKVCTFNMDGELYTIRVTRVRAVRGNDTNSSYIDIFKSDEDYNYPTTTQILDMTNLSGVVNSSSHCNAEMNTTYGPYNLCETAEEIEEALIYEFQFEFPRGLYNSSAGSFTERTVTPEVILEYQRIDNGTWDSFTLQQNYTDEDNSLIRKQISSPTTSQQGGTYKKSRFRVRRVTAEPTDTSSQDKLVLKRVQIVKEISFANSDYGDATFLWTKMKASNAISSQAQGQISAWVTRSDVGDTVADVVTDIVTNGDYGAGLDPSILNLPTTTEKVNGAFENEMTTAEALRVAGNAGRYQVKQDGNEITLTKDSVQSFPVCIFNETNIIKDTLTSSYSLGKAKDIDGFRVLYRNPDTFQEEEAVYPTTSDRPEVVELWGCTDATVALAEATYLWNKYIYKRNSIEFQTDYQGYIPQYMDKILVSHNLFKNSQATEVVSGTISVSGTRIITLADEVINTPNKMILRAIDGSPQEFTITASSGNEVTVTMLDTIELLTDFTTERTKVSLGLSSNMDKEYTIQSIKPSGENRMTIQAVNYDSRVYE